MTPIQNRRSVGGQCDPQPAMKSAPGFRVLVAHGDKHRDAPRDSLLD